MLKQSKGVDRDVARCSSAGHDSQRRPPRSPGWFCARHGCATRGSIDPPTLQAFFAAGYSKRQALDVVMGMAFSVMANYAGHLTRPPLDSFLTPHVWTR